MTITYQMSSGQTVRVVGMSAHVAEVIADGVEVDDPGPEDHRPSYSAYVHGCRCEGCRWARRRYVGRSDMDVVECRSCGASVSSSGPDYVTIHERYHCLGVSKRDVAS